MYPALIRWLGTRFMLCTDAAAEGINLQFCWIMINFDVPWNPARLEQRMGRIHRYGQKHDPVQIVNLAPSNSDSGSSASQLSGYVEYGESAEIRYRPLVRTAFLLYNRCNLTGHRIPSLALERDSNDTKPSKNWK